MFAKYQSSFYIANIKDRQVTLFTYDPSKSTESFEPKRDYFKKNVNLDDPDLSEIYDIHFYVKCNDSVEDTDIWLVDESRAVGLKANAEDNEVVIDVPHDAKNGSWISYEKGAAAKKIRLGDCEEYIVEKNYLKRDGKTVNELIERSSVTLNEFRLLMMMHRKENF